MRTLALTLGLIIFVLDQLTKWWVKNTLWLYDYTVVEGFVKIHYVRNEGIAFGLFHSVESQWKPVILAAMAVIAILVVLYYIWMTPSHRVGSFISLGLLMGGILGNFTDRVFHQYVTDFIEIHWKNQFTWPTFNIADAAITCGVLFVIYETFSTQEDPTSQHHERSGTNDTGS